MASVAEIGSAMKSLLTETARRLGRETKFVERASKLDGAGFAQTCVLGWWEHPDASLSQLSQGAASVGVAITPQGVDQRFDQEAASLLRALLEEAAHLAIGAQPTALPVLGRFSAVQVQDSTTINLPRGLADVWRGCGDAVGQHLAALKVQVRLDLLSGTLHDLLLAHGRTSDRTLAAKADVLPPGALALADLGYFAVARLAQIAQHQAFFLSRLQGATGVFDEEGQRLVLEEWLACAPPVRVEREVTIGTTERLPVRLLGVRLSQEVADQRRRRLKAEARRKGKPLPPRQLVLADWSLLVTNAPQDKLSLTDAFTLARVRWQIELLFKLWKSHGHIDAARSADPWRLLAEIYAKLIAMVVQHWTILLGCWPLADRSLVKAAAVVRAQALPLALAIAHPRQLGQRLRTLQRCLATSGHLSRHKQPSLAQLLLACQAP